MNFTLIDWVGLVISSVFAFVVFGTISSEAGYPRWHGLIMAVPLLNLVALVAFAYSNWPIEAKLLELEFQAAENATKAE